MKRFLQVILIVISVLIAISIPFDYVFSTYLKHSKARKYVGWNDIIYDSINADLLVLGGSRAWVHFDTYIMDSMLLINSYNLGIDGSSLNRQMLRYKIYEHYQKKPPKIILVNADFLGIIKTIGYEREQFFPYLWNRFTREEMRKTEPFTFGELYLPMYRYYKRSVYTTFLENKVDTALYLYKGYKGQNKDWDGSKYLEIDTFHFTKNEEVERDFDRFLGYLKEQNVKVVFVCPPIYIGLTYKVDNLPEYYETFQSYSDKYQIPMLDYKYYYLSYDTAYFYNSTHLNKIGAELFTTKLCHDLDSIGVFQP